MAETIKDDDQPVLKVAYPVLLTIAIMAATLLQILDQTIANVALPHMRASLGATQDTISWVLTSYIIGAAIAIPITGWLADRIGARTLLLGSVGTFIIASMLCGVAQSIGEIVLFRLVQGVSGAFIAPLAQTLMLDINRKRDHPRTMFIFGLGIMVGPIAGPIVGGWLTENLNWRWVFYVNVPIGLGSLVLLWLLLPAKPTLRRSFDLFGFLLLATGLASFQLLLDRGQNADWFASTEIWVEAALAASCFWMFGVQLLTARNPLYSLDMLRDRNLVGGSFLGLMMGLMMMSAMALLPPLLQSMFNYSVLETGLSMSSRGIGVVMTMTIVSRFSTIVDLRVVIALGFSIVALSLWMMTGWSLDMDQRAIVTTGFVQGLGLGLVFVPVTLMTFATLDSRFRTEASALSNLARSIGSSSGIAITTTMLARNMQVSHADLAQHVTYARLPIDPNIMSAYGTIGDTVMAYLNMEVTRQASMVAFIDDFRMMFLLSLTTIPIIFLLRRPRYGTVPAETHLAVE